MNTNSNKKQGSSLNAILVKTALVLLLFISALPGNSQNRLTGTLSPDGSNHYLGSVGINYTDFVIPQPGARPYLQLYARGGDGGRQPIEKLKGFKYVEKFHAKGGQGAELGAAFKIGVGPGELKPGSTLRTIVGLAGTENANKHGLTGQIGGGGGGGTGVLYLPAGADAHVPANWKILLVAGGGGGACAGTAGNTWNGEPGQITEDGGKESSRSNSWQWDKHCEDFRKLPGKAGAGGFFEDDKVGAGGGTSYQTWAERAAGKNWNIDLLDSHGLGSATSLVGTPFHDAEISAAPGGSGLFQYQNGYRVPIGGKGGSGRNSGGYGFGGGGGSEFAGVADWSGGGGGGGYSGGWSGTGGVGGHLSGNGGGSYVNASYAIAGTTIRKKNGTTDQAANGHIDYYFLNTISTSSITKDQDFINGGTRILQAGNFRLEWQGDGNLVLYEGGTARWASGTNGTGTALYFTSAGDLLITNDSGSTLWHSNTSIDDTKTPAPISKGGYRLLLNPQGKLYITNEDNVVIWTVN